MEFDVRRLLTVTRKTNVTYFKITKPFKLAF